MNKGTTVRSEIAAKTATGRGPYRPCTLAYLQPEHVSAAVTSLRTGNIIAHNASTTPEKGATAPTAPEDWADGLVLSALPDGEAARGGSAATRPPCANVAI